MHPTAEKRDLEAAVQETESTMSQQKEASPTNVDFERNELLASLPDPDHGKSDKERQAIDKKLMRKVDIALVPWLAILYLLSFLDRANIGNARLAGMEADLGMSGKLRPLLTLHGCWR